MANIASGYLSIRIKGEQAASELSSSIEESGLFSYGGDIDIKACNEELNIGFSCAWNGDDCWDWIDEQLSAGSALSDQCKEALRNAEIDGYTYEYGCQHRDRISKKRGEKILKREQADLPDEICYALQICKAYDLNAGEQLNVAGGSVTLLSKSASPKDEYGEEYEYSYSFSMQCGHSMEITIYTIGNVHDDSVIFNTLEPNLDNYDPDEGLEPEETIMYKEIIDGIVSGFNEIYT